MLYNIIQRFVELPLLDYIIPAPCFYQKKQHQICLANHVYRFVQIQLLSYNLITQWNKLPNHTVNTTSLDNFKSLLKSHL